MSGKSITASLVVVACVGCAESSAPLPLPPEQAAEMSCRAGDVSLGNWPFCCPSAPALLPGSARIQAATATDGHHALARLASAEGTTLRLATDGGDHASVQVSLYDERCVFVAAATGLHPGDGVPLALRRARYYVVATSSGGSGPVSLIVDGDGDPAGDDFPEMAPLSPASAPCAEAPPGPLIDHGSTSWCVKSQAIAPNSSVALFSCGDHRGSYFMSDGDACGIVIGDSVRAPADFAARVAQGQAGGLMVFEEYDPTTQCDFVNADAVKTSVAGPGQVFLRAGRVRRLDMLDASPGSLTLAVVARPDPAVLPILIPPGRAVVDGCDGTAGTPF